MSTRALNALTYLTATAHAFTTLPSAGASQVGEGVPIWSTVMWTAAAAIISAIATAMISRNTKISEFRQAWIISLREDIATFLSKSSQWNDSRLKGEAEIDPVLKDKMRSEREEPLLGEAQAALWRIEMRINPEPNRNSAEDERFLSALFALRPATFIGDQAAWRSSAATAVLEARRLLKREWQVTKRLARWNRLGG